MTRPAMLPLRQLQCLRLAAAGLDHDEIAKRLHLSTQTVGTYMKLMRQRLKARNTTHAVALGWCHGLISAEDVDMA